MISNNLPKIQDTATQTEDGLLSYADKIKIDTIDTKLNEKLDKTTKITSAMMDTSSNTNKIQPNNLSDSVKAMMTGTTPVSPTIGNGSIVTEYLANESVNYTKLDKRLLQGFIVGPSPLNFIFDTVKVTIKVPQHTMLLVDSTTQRNFIASSDTKDVTVNLNYPADHDKVNALYSKADGSLELLNYRKFNTVAKTSILVAFIYYNNSEPVVVMNGQFTINGVRQGIGTESAALFGPGKIVLDAKTGIIDFTKATALYFVVNGVYKSIISNQENIRIASYEKDQTYCLYWDRPSGTLKVAQASNSNTDTNTDKLAIIHSGLISPYVNSGIWYSKPYIEAQYTLETLENTNTTALICKTPVNFNTVTNKLELATGQSFVVVNDQITEVKTYSIPFSTREGIQLIWFNLDNGEIKINYYKDELTGVNAILLGTFWFAAGVYPQVSGNFKFTVNGKSDYANDISEITGKVTALENKFACDLKTNLLLAPNDIYMITGQPMQLFKSSLVTDDNNGVETAIKYNKNGDASIPIVNKFDDIELESSNIGTSATVYANSKYSPDKFSSKKVNVHAVLPNANTGKEVKLLCIGDQVINAGAAKLIRDRLNIYGMKPKMIGTMVNSLVAGEGRDGWMYSTFTGASGRGVKLGTIMPQLSRGTSSILLNPFLRVATADDKAKNPNICYRQTGALEEKSYYSDSNKNGQFYIFDFASYLDVQGIDTPDIITISVSAANTFRLNENGISSCINNLKQMVSNIRAKLPDVIIAIVPQYALSKKESKYWTLSSTVISQIAAYITASSDPNLYSVPVYCHQNREFIYSTTDEIINGYTINTINDNNIMNDYGLQQFANALSAFIMNV